MNDALITIVAKAIDIFSVLILIDVIASWIMVLRVNLPAFLVDILRAIHNITGVLLNPIRRLIPSLGGLDISPIIALVLLSILRQLLLSLLAR